MDLLRILSSLELYLNADFYGKHPVFVKICESIPKTSVENVLCVSVCHDSIDSGLMGVELIKAEAVSICKYLKKWSGFLAILSLSSVINRNIVTYYPDFGPERYKIMFNQEIAPRICGTNVYGPSVNILF